MSKLFEEMAQATAEARAYMEGERTGCKVTFAEVDRAKQKQSNMSLGATQD